MAKRFVTYKVKLVREEAGLYECDNVVKSPGSAHEVIQTVLDLNSEAVEKFGILSLDTKNKVTGIHIISVGSLDTSLVHPREVFKPAILNNSAGIICFHNHPSGNPEPSTADIDTTKRLKDAGELIGIPVVDHIIVGDGIYCSFMEKGLI